MFTIKYRTYSVSRIQPPADCIAPTAFYDEHELIDGPFAMVSKEIDDGYVVVYAHREHNAPGMTFGPVKVDAAGQPRPTLWVMNEAGATVAKYDL
jgi:hypothetical protein